MPNTVVKLINAESTWLEAAWEDRKLLIKKERDAQKCVSFFVVSAREEGRQRGRFLYGRRETITGAGFRIYGCRGLMLVLIYWKRRDRISLQLPAVD